MRPHPYGKLPSSRKLASRACRICVVLLAFAVVVLGTAANARAATFVVNSAADVPDATPGDGICETATGNGVCTLRAAIQESNVLYGPDTIQLQASTTYLLARVGQDDTALNGDLDILDSVTIVGAGAGSTIIDGNGSITGDRVFQVFQCIQNKIGASSCIIGDVHADITGVTIEHGSAASAGGGAIFNAQGYLTVTDSLITGNSGKFGGGIYSANSLDLERSTLSNNVSEYAGGGIAASGSATIIQCSILNNSISTSGYGGGGISVTGDTKVRESVIAGNSASYGGGIYTAGTTDVVNSTLSGNFAHGNGGGIYVATGAVTTGLYNATVAGNQANDDASGVGIGGGVDNAGTSTISFQNSIIATNTNVIATVPYPTLNDDDCAGTITSISNNLMYTIDTSHCTLVGSVTIADPKLGLLQNNGGPTETRALLSGSPAIDAGNASGCTDELGATLTTDQRGYPRPSGSACDIGAFELQPDTIFKDGFE